jgi:ribonuclease HII
MQKLAKTYPEYGFEQHKGYGTAVHREALHKYGPTPIHRELFLRKVLG